MRVEQELEEESLVLLFSSNSSGLGYFNVEWHEAWFLIIHGGLSVGGLIDVSTKSNHNLFSLDVNPVE